MACTFLFREFLDKMWKPIRSSLSGNKLGNSVASNQNSFRKLFFKILLQKKKKESANLIRDMATIRAISFLMPALLILGAAETNSAT